MTRSKCVAAICLALGVLAVGAVYADGGTVKSGENEKLTPPEARRGDTVHEHHGDRRTDPYSWLREKGSKEVVDYLRAEDKYASTVMAPTEKLQETLYQEMLGRIQQTDLSTPYFKGGYYYYSRTQEGQQYSIQCRKKGSLEAPEQVILDGNELIQGHDFFGLGVMRVSPDGKKLAYSTDFSGFREYTLYVKDLETGKLLPDRIGKVKSVAWLGNDKLYYTTDDAAKRPYQVWLHELGGEKDKLVYEEKDERFRVGVSLSRSERILFLESHSLTTSEVRFLDTRAPEAGFRMITPRRQDHEYDVDHRGDHFYILTNDKGRNSRLVTAPVATPGEDHWSELLPHSEDALLLRVSCFRDHVVVSERAEGLSQIRVLDGKSPKGHRIAFPEAAYTAWGAQNAEFGLSKFRLSYTSMTTPRSIYDYDVKTRKLELLKQTPVLGGYDPANYRTERIHATAADGTQVPISLVYHKSIDPRGKNPLYLNGYGSYGSSRSPSFSSARVSLLDRGAIFALAHIRGGSEMGKRWHDEGRMFRKMNTFTDFIAVADHLVKEGYTSRKRLVIQGGSAGGLLVGAVANLRPDLCRAVISHVPFVDVLNTMLDETLPLTVGEFEEWGNPKIKEQYEYIRQYCPYTNLAARNYPAMLVKTSYNDSQVMYWEPAKYVARLRHLKKDNNPLLFKVNMEGGHGGSSGRYDRLRETAFDYSFFLWQVGQNVEE